MPEGESWRHAGCSRFLLFKKSLRLGNVLAECLCVRVAAPRSAAGGVSLVSLLFSVVAPELAPSGRPVSGAPRSSSRRRECATLWQERCCRSKLLLPLWVLQRLLVGDPGCFISSGGAACVTGCLGCAVLLGNCCKRISKCLSQSLVFLRLLR